MKVLQSLQKIVLMNLSQFLILVLSVETRHIGGAINIRGSNRDFDFVRSYHN